jgi:hypothetical protein
VSVLTWDQVGDRRYEAGVDRGVLYLPDTVVPWNGLTSIEEIVNRESKSFYQDGIKYLDFQVLGEYAATLKAYTYPDEFDQVMGIATDGRGLYIHDQRPKTFDLCYRTKIGNDLDGLDHGYRIHLLYNLLATPSNVAFGTVESNAVPIEFQWALSSTPEFLSGYRPTAHLSLKSTDFDAGYLAFVESLLYGTDTSEPYLPSMAEMFDLVANRITIVDNGDGSWTATGSDRVVELLNATTFQLSGVQATFLSEGTYEITIPAF